MRPVKSTYQNGGLFDKGRRLRRRAGRQQRRLYRMLSYDPSKMEEYAEAFEGSEFEQPIEEKPMFDFDLSGIDLTPSNDGCPPGQSRGITGSCESGDLKAEKSEVVVMPPFNPTKSRYNLRTVGDPQKEKELADKIMQNLAEARRLEQPPRKFSNPRFL